jgi:hypothetical protein
VSASKPWYVSAVPLNRRDFFGQFWGADGKRAHERRARTDSLETYAWTNLLPYDFALSEPQYKDLARELKAYLAGIPDDELFSVDMTRHLEEFINALVDPWRRDYFSDNFE